MNIIARAAKMRVSGYINFALAIVLFFAILQVRDLKTSILKLSLSVHNLQHRAGALESDFGIANDKTKELTEELDSITMATNARIDILNNSIDPERTRRERVAQIRKAIIETAHGKVTVRDMNNIAGAAIDYSYKYNIPISHILAIIRVESNFDKRAESHAGAQGLMQIMPRTRRYLELEYAGGRRLNPQNIHHNILAGCAYISEQYHDFGNFDDALAAYNWGSHNLLRYKAQEITVMPKETQEYVPKVNYYIELYKKYGLD